MIEKSHNLKTVESKSCIFLTGVACVGKTTIGSKLASLLEYRFYDLDTEVEAFYKLSIERMQKQHKSMNDFRIAAARFDECLLECSTDKKGNECCY